MSQNADAVFQAARTQRPAAGNSSIGARPAHRVLMTLSTRERELFLPGFSVNGLSGAEWEFFPSCEHSGESWLAKLDAFQPTVLVTNWSSRVIPASFFKRPDCFLRYVCHMTGTVRHLVPRLFLEQGGVVSNWCSLAGPQVAEHALLLALSSLRRQPSWRDHMRRPKSPADWPVVDIGTRTLFSKRVGIHGFGHVARRLVGLLKPFGVRISAWSEGVPASLFEEYDVASAGSLGDLFASSDVLFECEALTPRTEGCVEADILSLLPDGAVFVNVGRGLTVCEKALHREVESGRIHVALDVLGDEGKSHESPLLALENAILSPHIGGPTLDQLPELGRFAMGNVARFLDGLPPEGMVTLEQYDRAT